MLVRYAGFSYPKMSIGAYMNIFPEDFPHTGKSADVNLRAESPAYPSPRALPPGWVNRAFSPSSLLLIRINH
jgi:hypothetical protein